MSIDDKAAFTFKINALDQLSLLNPDRKSTVLQKRMSLKGRKSLKNLDGPSDESSQLLQPPRADDRIDEPESVLTKPRN